jgi:hypothetical protein
LWTIARAWEVGGQGEHSLPLFVAEDLAIRSALSFIILLSFRVSAEPVIPFALQTVGYETIVRIDLHEASTREVYLIARAFDLLVTQAVCLLDPCREFMLHCEGHLERNRGDHRYQLRANKLVDIGTRDGLADRLAAFDAFALADVAGMQTVTALVVAYAHAAAALSADHQSLQ